MRNKIIYIMLLFLVSSFACINRQSDSDIERALENIIVKHYHLYEGNPIYLEEAEQLNLLFATVLKQRKNLDESKKNEYRKKATEIAYYKTIEDLESVGFEDSPDERRVKTKYSMGNAIIALLSDYKQSATYLTQAKAILELEPGELMDNEYAGILLVQLLKKYDNHDLNHNEIETAINKVQALIYLSKESKDEIGSLLLRITNKKRLTSKSSGH